MREITGQHISEVTTSAGNTLYATNSYLDMPILRQKEAYLVFTQYFGNFTTKNVVRNWLVANKNIVNYKIQIVSNSLYNL